MNKYKRYALINRIFDTKHIIKTFSDIDEAREYAEVMKSSDEYCHLDILDLNTLSRN